jgi:hypothetical protein
MMLPRVLWSPTVTLLLLAACAKEKPAVHPGDEKPDTQGIEGHGGIAIEAPSATPVLSPPAVAPTPGVVDPSDFLLERECTPESAKEFYLRGYVLRPDDPDLAMSLFKKVVQCTPPEHEYHQKALARIREAP